MGECICNSCRNLKSVFDEEGEEGSCECVFGYPSEECAECESGQCDKTCGHYLYDDGEDEYTIVNCKKCGKALKKAFKDEPQGEILCIDCFLDS